MSENVIEKIETVVFELPVKRIHELSGARMKSRTLLLIRILTQEGLEGIGEVTLPGGPWWTGDTILGARYIIEHYFIPRLIGKDPFRIHYLMEQLDRVAYNNNPAKAGVEMALFDLKAKALQVPLYELLGGLYHEQIPITWALGSSNVQEEIEEALTKLGDGFCRRFKIKMGFLDPADDVKRVKQLCKELGGKADLLIDLNASWDESTAIRYLPGLIDAGVNLVEQPLERDNLLGLARVASRINAPIILDESSCTLPDVKNITQVGANVVLSLKLMKTGGIVQCQRMAEIARLWHLKCYGGSFLESSIGAAANIHFGASLPGLAYGAEWVGPGLLADEIVVRKIGYQAHHVKVPGGHGLGVEIDEDKLKYYKNKSNN